MADIDTDIAALLIDVLALKLTPRPYKIYMCTSSGTFKEAKFYSWICGRRERLTKSALVYTVGSTSELMRNASVGINKGSNFGGSDRNCSTRNMVDSST